jgi:type VI secretion system protein VasD
MSRLQAFINAPTAPKLPGRLLLCGLLLCGPLWSGCTGPKTKAPQPTLIDAQLSAAADVNANASGQGQPLVLTLYQLASGDRFAQADYFAIAGDPEAVLGKDLLAHEQITIKPKARRRLSVTAADGARVLGVVAAFQAIDQATWQALHPLREQTTNRLDIALGPRSVAIR